MALLICMKQAALLLWGVAYAARVNRGRGNPISLMMKRVLEL